MQIEGSKQNGKCIIKVAGRMDAVSAPEFESACAQWVEQGESSFVVDLEGLEYISSAGLRSLLIVAKKLKSVGGAISFCALSPMVMKVFSISGFASMFTIHDSLEKAMKSS